MITHHQYIMAMPDQFENAIPLTGSLVADGHIV
jgi:hypothetical protein